ncbi:hypothetical protein ATKI12_8008 [Kitasatospora sp. Ki12]
MSRRAETRRDKNRRGAVRRTANRPASPGRLSAGGRALRPPALVS